MCLTLDELLQVVLDLLPGEVDVCVKLIAALRDSHRVATSRVGKDPGDVYTALATFVQTELENSKSAQLHAFAKQANLFLDSHDYLKHKLLDAQEGELEQNTDPENTPVPLHRGDKIMVPLCTLDEDKTFKADDSWAFQESACEEHMKHADSSEGPALDTDPSVAAERQQTVNTCSSERVMQTLSELKWLPDEEIGGVRERCFVLFDDPAKSKLGRCINVFIVLVIAVSTVSFIMESMPEFRYVPSECSERRAAGIALTAEACEPRPVGWLYVVEAVCVGIFTAEYLLRVSMVHALAKGNTSGLRKTIRYALLPLSVVDALAVLPFYIDLIIGNSLTGFVRILRLARIIRMLKVAKHHPGISMFVDALLLSGQPLLMLLFLDGILTVLLGSLVYFAEGQRFSVAPEFTEAVKDAESNISTPARFPTGVFVRWDTSMQDQATPFRSIPYGIWWAAVTMTTVGYGDYAPTTMMGKAVGLVTFYTGIVMIALPIGVISLNFGIVYERYYPKPKSDPQFRKALLKSQTLDQISMMCSCGAGLTGLQTRIFRTLEFPQTSGVAKTCFFILMGAVLVSTATFVMESMPEFTYTPEACKPGQLTVENCRPRSQPAFMVIEQVCVTLFTLDYVLRMLCVHTHKAREIGIKCKGRDLMGPLEVTIRYLFQPLNLIDLLAIAPFYMQLMGFGDSTTTVIRVLRLTRCFRCLKSKKMQGLVDMILNVVIESLPALVTLLLLTSLMCVFFASCLVYAEGTNFSVDHFKDEYPEGVYIRPTIDGYDEEPTPFVSIFYAFWWFFTTTTTVGYGDDVPTTTLGRCVGVMTFYTGIVLLAMPVSIIGGKFEIYYPKWKEQFEQEAANKDKKKVHASKAAMVEAPQENPAINAPKEVWS